MAVNTNSKKDRGLVLMLAGIGTGALAQAALLFFVNNTFPLLGLFLYVLAEALLFLGMHTLGDVLPVFEVKTQELSRRKPGFEFWLISLGMVGAIAIHTARAEGNDRYGYFFAAAWAVAILLPVYSALIDESWRPPAIEAITTWLKEHRAELFVITTILVAAFLIRFLDVELHPYSFINDEGHMGSGAECILQGQCTNFFNLGWAAQPLLAYVPYALSIWLFGETALAVRLVSVLTGTLSVLAIYLFAREVFNKKVAWLSALLLTSLPVHVHFSRTGVDNIIDSLTAPLILWLLFRGAKRGSRLSFLAAGIVSGFCLYTYPGSLLAPVLGAGAIAYLALRTRAFLQAHVRNIIVFMLAASVVIIPLLGYYSNHTDLFLARLKKESILQNGVLQNTARTSGKSAVEILAWQFEKSSLAYIAMDAPFNFFNSPKAYLPPLEALFFMFGLAYLLWRIKDPRYIVIFIWFWAVVILGSALTGYPPATQRILMSLPAVVLMVAIGVTKILQACERFRPAMAKFIPGILLAFILFNGYTNINFYFYDYRIGHYYEETQNELTYEAQFYITPLHEQGRMFLIGDPKVPYLIFKSFDYFSPDVEKRRLNNITSETLLYLQNDKDVLFIALPDYKSEIELVAQWIPGGEWHEVKRRYQPQYTLFYVYRITRAQLMNFIARGGYEGLLH